MMPLLITFFFFRLSHKRNVHLVVHVLALSGFKVPKEAVEDEIGFEFMVRTC